MSSGVRRPRAPGHRKTCVPLGPTKARRRVPQGWRVECKCGWNEQPFRTRLQAEKAYSKHHEEALPICSRCREVKGPTQMSKGAPHLCKSCVTAKTRAWAAEHPEEWERSRRASWLRLKYGLSVRAYDALLASQGGCCAICMSPPADPRGYAMHVDHDHQTGHVRGILCGPCNKGIGMLGDDAARLERAAAYLQAARKIGDVA